MYRSSLQDEADYNHAIEYAAEKAAKKAAEKAAREAAEKATRKATASKAREVASNLIRATDFDNLTIAKLAGLEETAIEAIRREQRRQ